MFGADLEPPEVWLASENVPNIIHENRLEVGPRGTLFIQFAGLRGAWATPLFTLENVFQ